MPTLTPAYGRDYSSAAKAKEAYHNGSDWILNDITSPWNGKYCSCRDFDGVQVMLRYKNNENATFTVWNR